MVGKPKLHQPLLVQAAELQPDGRDLCVGQRADIAGLHVALGQGKEGDGIGAAFHLGQRRVQGRADPGARLFQRRVAGLRQGKDRAVAIGAAVVVARRGQIVLDEAIGLSDLANGRAARLDDVYPVMSVSKSVTAVSVLARADRGDFMLTTPVAEIIPEFGILGKQRITIAQLLSHTGGMPSAFPPLPPSELGNLEAAVAAICAMPLEGPFGEVSYSIVAAHYILAEIVRRIDGGSRPFRKILQDELFTPLAMTSSCLGMQDNLRDRRVPIVVRDQDDNVLSSDLLEAMNEVYDNESEMPAASIYATAGDMHRFAEMLRRGGELDGARILSPAMVGFAATSHSGDEPGRVWAFAREMKGWADAPANSGLGFFLRGEGIHQSFCGTLATPGAFGNAGAGSTVFWVDPGRELTFVCLTAGLIEETRSWARWQRLSDLAHSAVVD